LIINSIFQQIKELKKEINADNKDILNKMIIYLFLTRFLCDRHWLSDSPDTYITDKISFNRLLSNWAGQKIKWMDTDEISLSQREKELLKRKIGNIPNLKNENSRILGQIYEYLLDTSYKKKKGVFYTPPEMITNILLPFNHQLSEKLSILDPAVGCGFFLSECYDMIQKSSTNRDQTHRILLEETLNGMDIDKMAVMITCLVLVLKNRNYRHPAGIIHGDFLTEELQPEVKYDIIVGNPPYIGHKKLDSNYKMVLKKKYNQVYYNKGDIYFCFFMQGINKLKKRGKLVYITSRYYFESDNGTGLRKFLQENGHILQIIDFYGQRPIKGAKVDLSILYYEKNCQINSLHKITIARHRRESKIVSEDTRWLQNFGIYEIKQNMLDKSGWQLNSPVQERIFTKIWNSCLLTLDDIVFSFQGVITGCDRAFIYSEKEKEKFPGKYLKPWLKSRNIHSGEITSTGSYLLNTDLIHEIDREHAVLEALIPYKERLEKRRECVRGIRPWYQLQWGRNAKWFEREKIIFPYKANRNRFALDKKHSYFSADIYGFFIKDEFRGRYTEEWLVKLLNTGLYNYLFHIFGKKLGRDLYEYYPNTVMKLRIPDSMTDFESDEDILNCFGLDLEEQQIIKDYI
jgi:adenine-specific DNA-methyltransferase